MGWLFKRAKSDFDDMQLRDRMLKDLQQYARAHDMVRLHATLSDLSARQMFNDPLVASVMRGVVDIIAEKSPRDAFGILLNNFNREKNPEFYSSLADKALTMMDRMVSPAPGLNATIAMTCLVIADNARPGSMEDIRSRAHWQKAMHALSDTRDPQSLNYAFAAASNAAVKNGNARAPLRQDALDAWEKLVVKLAKTDLRAACDEIFRVTRNYHAFGAGARAFQDRALLTLKKI